MKLLLLTQRFPPALGGVENHVWHLGQGLIAHGDEVEVITTDLRKDIPFERLEAETENFSFPVHRLRAIKAAPLPHALGNVAPAMLRQVLSGSWDIIHAHAYGYFPTFVAATGRFLGRSALVITPHSDPGRPSLEKRVFDTFVPIVTLKRADRVVALTHLEARYLESLGVAGDRIVVIPNGVDIDEFLPPSEGLRQGDGTTVLFAGRCYPQQKGLETLMRATSLLPAEARVHVRIVGEDWGGYAVVGGMAKSLGIEDRVTLVGRLERAQVVEEFHRADLFVLPSLFDSFPIVLLEAMAAGLPVVATSVGGIPEVVEDGRTGLLVEPGNPQALSAALERLAQAPSVRKEMGRRGRERARLFSWEQIVLRTRQVYEDAIATRGR